MISTIETRRKISSMVRFLINFAGFFLCGVLYADAQVTYVGDGRYTCRGSVRECEAVQRRNDLLELQRLQNHWLELEQQELQKQVEALRQDRERAGGLRFHGDGRRIADRVIQQDRRERSLGCGQKNYRTSRCNGYSHSSAVAAGNLTLPARSSPSSIPQSRHSNDGCTLNPA